MLSAENSEDEYILVEKVELIQKFLLKYNFQKLRASDERLSGSIDSEVVIFRDKNGLPDFKIKD